MHLSSSVIIVSVQICIASSFVNKTSISNKWEDFKIKFNKTYETNDEEMKRFEIFQENCANFEAHNKLYETGKVTFKIDVNRRADLTDDDIESLIVKKPRLVLNLYKNQKKKFQFG